MGDNENKPAETIGQCDSCDGENLVTEPTKSSRKGAHNVYHICKTCLAAGWTRPKHPVDSHIHSLVRVLRFAGVLADKEAEILTEHVTGSGQYTKRTDSINKQCINCGAIHAFEEGSPEVEGTLNVFCPGGTCEGQYVASN